MSGLELRGLSKRFGSTVAVEDLHLTAAPGELVALLGPSGCGKTTTLRMVAGFERPDAGRVLLDGRDVTELPPERRGVGIVFQNYALFPHMTVAQNIGYGLAVRSIGARERRRRAEELLALMGLEGLAGRRPEALSAGQQQRVALARALAPEPRLLLLDEPLSALDAPVRRHLRAEIRRVQQELGITTLYVTHDQEEALATADRIAVLQAGRPEQVGSPEEVYLRPRSPFVAAFIGNGNVWETTVEGEAGGGLVAVRVGDQRWLVPCLERAHAKRSDEDASMTSAAPGPGSTVHVVVRPERLRLQAGAEAAPADNRAGVNWVEGRLRDVEYLGHAAMVRAELAGLEARALVPGERAGELRHRRGEDVVFTFAADAAWLVWNGGERVLPPDGLLSVPAKPPLRERRS
ncbi:ABC transporter ATP-binding protein [Limnochorda pilosa]|uniref:ABC-type quaternary amine transporter n=1 Tax=Limnochorda pilosa TaxID=1555112 RepID=A0A0K2SIB7_LIMPI|nr:ABC transporter ATP-binding protein [Limnochorda pilosa]BAS26871.1 spermidine/putrescine ABC transporter ATP-binding protein [Limnochorda pilosa]